MKNDGPQSAIVEGKEAGASDIGTNSRLGSQHSNANQKMIQLQHRGIVNAGQPHDAGRDSQMEEDSQFVSQTQGDTKS